MNLIKLFFSTSTKILMDFNTILGEIKLSKIEFHNVEFLMVYIKYRYMYMNKLSFPNEFIFSGY